MTAPQLAEIVASIENTDSELTRISEAIKVTTQKLANEAAADIPAAAVVKERRRLKNSIEDLEQEQAIVTARRDELMEQLTIVGQDGFDRWKDQLDAYRDSEDEVLNAYWESDEVTDAIEVLSVVMWLNRTRSRESSRELITKQVNKRLSELDTEGMKKAASKRKLVTTPPYTPEDVSNAMNYASLERDSGYRHRDNMKYFNFL